MSTILWIIIFGLLMSCIALVGSLTLMLKQDTWNALILPLVAFAAGSLIGGAVLHMIPAAVESMGNVTALYCWLMAGFMVFYALEEFLNWHHSHTHSHACSPCSPPHEHVPPSSACDPMGDSITHICGLDNALSRDGNDKSTLSSGTTKNEQQSGPSRSQSNDIESPGGVAEAPTTENRVEASVKTQPIIHLIIVADAVHNFLGGMFVGASFVDSVELGISAWLAAAAHEIPQELGDFAVLVHGGWSKRRALLLNFLSALTFPLGGVIAYAASKTISVAFLVPFAAGNFLYIGASDLVPEVKHFHGIRRNALHFSSFCLGVIIMLGIRVAVKGW